jgi:hypothetical protein
MSEREKPPAIVAELGRPETPAETAARKAANSRKHREKQTVNNLWLSLLVTLGIVLVLVLLVPRGNDTPRTAVDYRQVAAEAQPSIEQPLAVPELNTTWRSNVAELRTGAADGVSSWYVGFVTPKDDYLGFSQGLDANESWLAALLQNSRASGTEDIGGLTWTVYDNQDSGGHGNVEYALTTEDADGIYAVYGTADPTEAKELATAVARSIETEGSAK